ncbi:DegT/DnrJ/EryC1/StrS family aminotransferase [Lunatimonas salinarum]|uniref:DegT/DnrJ/EryC1/StrS family aminotransferase n=1 Tax=Lunatimonas salinarum TaxID=1774590 RepID=UPI001ADFE63A|nr:aminotransferase class I/II-fold pyridoxal phosphate-dependent enzyme [Lunatimonas salinarum]
MQKTVDNPKKGLTIRKLPKIWLSSPHMGGGEQAYVKQAFDTNWVAPLGPNVNAFEERIVKHTDCGHAAVLNSGTAALHLALIMLGVGRDDYVICQTFTFAASANPIRYLGAVPVFVDSESETWNICPQAVEDAIKGCLAGTNGSRAKLPKAIVCVDLYGMPAKLHELRELAQKYGIPLVEDAAEALGSTYGGKHCGTFGDIGIFSFNGNKIITTSGGGALVSKNEHYANRARFLATQAREDFSHYEHQEIGYNYRMSNISAGIGRGQMDVLDERVAQRRHNFQFYRNALERYDGVEFIDEPNGSFSNRWLSTMLIRPELTGGVTREDIRVSLLSENIESRPFWKPMHLQPVFSRMPYAGGTVARHLFDLGLCLPSGSNLREEDLDRVIRGIRKVLEAKRNS